MKKTIFQNFILALLIAVVSFATISSGAEGVPPIADAGLPRYAAQDPVVLDGTVSYDPDNSGPLIYMWQQISGPSVIISDVNTATPTISGFFQTDEIQECEFELIVNDGEYDSSPDTVRVVIVTDFGDSNLRLQNDSFDPNKPTFIYFGGGNCVTGSGSWGNPAWVQKANIIDFPYYSPDRWVVERTFYKYGDMIIVYLSSVAPNYKQPIQTSGWSTGGQPAIDVGIRLNLTYVDARYAVNRVTFLDATRYCRDNYSKSITTFLGSSVDGEQCWIDAYVSTLSGGNNTNKKPYHENVLNVWFPAATGSWSLRHELARNWYMNSLKYSDMNNFNYGVIGGAYWSVVGPGKNLQLASTPGTQIYKFQWYGKSTTGDMDFYDESKHPGRLPEPVTLVGPEDGAYVNANGAIFSCEESENAVGYQLLFGSDQYRVMDYHFISDTPNPPTEIITSFPYEKTWWTIQVYDVFGSTIYADPVCVYPENIEALEPNLIDHLELDETESIVTP